MEKTATLNLRVNPITKQKAETVLKQLGIPMSVAMEMYLNQIAMVGGIPFSVTLPKTCTAHGPHGKAPSAGQPQMLP